MEEKIRRIFFQNVFHVYVHCQGQLRQNYVNKIIKKLRLEMKLNWDEMHISFLQMTFKGEKNYSVDHPNRRENNKNFYVRFYIKIWIVEKVYFTTAKCINRFHFLKLKASRTLSKLCLTLWLTLSNFYKEKISKSNKNEKIIHIERMLQCLLFPVPDEQKWFFFFLLTG